MHSFLSTNSSSQQFLSYKKPIHCTTTTTLVFVSETEDFCLDCHLYLLCQSYLNKNDKTNSTINKNTIPTSGSRSVPLTLASSSTFHVSSSIFDCRFILHHIYNFIWNPQVFDSCTSNVTFRHFPKLITVLNTLFYLS